MSRDLKPKIIYQPKYKENQIVKFTKFVEKKYGTKLENYWELHEWSCKNYPEFWGSVWEFFGITSSLPYVEVFDRNRSFQDMEWFRGARLNYTENIFKHRDSHVALIAVDEWDNARSVTYSEMYDEVCVYARTLKNHGIKKGDVIACYMPNKIEAVFAFLATASLGAIWCGTMPLLGVKTLLQQFLKISPKILFTSGNFQHAEREIKMFEKLREIVPAVPTLEKVVIVSNQTSSKNDCNITEVKVMESIRSIPKCYSISEFLEEAFEEFKVRPWKLEYEQVPFDHPCTITFTSGTTGMPKEIIHSTGAFFATLRDFGLSLDITRRDVIMNLRSVGWILWNVLVNTLHLGSPLLLYQGTNACNPPSSLGSKTTFWDLVERYGITTPIMSSSGAEDLEKKGCLPSEEHTLSTLRQIFTCGEFTKPQTYDFFQKIKPGIFSFSLYGSTEMCGCISGADNNLPVYRGETQAFALGMDVKCLDHFGNPVIGENGSIVIASPHPGMFINLKEEFMKQKYLAQYPGYFFMSDDIWINPVTKGFVVYGRSDETVIVGATNVKDSDISFALQNFPGLIDSVFVPHYNAEMKMRPVLFVQMQPGIILTESLKNDIRITIERNVTYIHLPAVIMQVPDVPYNLNGKKMTVLVKKLINKQHVVNEDSVINPEAIEFFRNVELGEF